MTWKTGMAWAFVSCVIAGVISAALMAATPSTTVSSSDAPVPVPTAVRDAIRLGTGNGLYYWDPGADKFRPIRIHSRHKVIDAMLAKLFRRVACLEKRMDDHAAAFRVDRLEAAVRKAHPGELAE